MYSAKHVQKVEHAANDAAAAAADAEAKVEAEAKADAAVT